MTTDSFHNFSALIPRADGLPGYEARLRHLLNWLHGWDIELSMREDDDEAYSIVTPPPHTSVKGNSLFKAPAYDHDEAGFKPGAIRILSASVAGVSPQVPYVFLLGDWTQEWSWVMPFSPFPDPATDHELLTEMEPNPLRVLQVWQARSLPNDMLKKSWFVTQAPDSLVGEAKALYSNLLRGDNRIPETLIPRIGARLSGEKSDPRLAYLDEQTARLESITALSLLWMDETPAERSPDVIRFPIPFTPKAPALAAAASSPDGRVEFAVWRVVNTDICLTLAELSTEPNAYTLRVENDAKRQLERATVRDGDQVIGTILQDRAGDSESPLRFTHREFAINDKNGRPVDLVQILP